MQSSCFRMHVLALPRGMRPINLALAVEYGGMRLQQNCTLHTFKQTVTKHFPYPNILSILLLLFPIRFNSQIRRKLNKY